jgi:hypothetical protein
MEAYTYEWPLSGYYRDGFISINGKPEAEQEGGDMIIVDSSKDKEEEAPTNAAGVAEPVVNAMEEGGAEGAEAIA